MSSLRTGDDGWVGEFCGLFLCHSVCNKVIRGAHPDKRWNIVKGRGRVDVVHKARVRSWYVTTKHHCETECANGCVGEVHCDEGRTL